MSKLTLMVGTPVIAVAVVAAAVLWRFSWFVAPLVWTGEPAALAAALAVTPGMRVADVGAGDGAMAAALARIVGPAGRVFATELSATSRQAIDARMHREALGNVATVVAQETATGLPDACCDALYLRHVFHHPADRAGFVAALTRAVRPGGRIAVIDFPPGALWFHGADHGVSADQVRAAFWAKGWRQVIRQDDWGGGTYLVVFER